MKLCHCGTKSVPGLVKHIALCQYHYDARMFGLDWANYVRYYNPDTLSRMAKHDLWHHVHLDFTTAPLTGGVMVQPAPNGEAVSPPTYERTHNDSTCIL